MKTCTTIPELLQKVGSMESLAKKLGCSKVTVFKYSLDKSGVYHAVVNGTLMTSTATRCKRGKHAD
ncbi:protein ninH [uncultured Cedecea sp.]|uniref:protein ninH n=1 Tax=uncultured Cedecea sp. TaxID=988762 RepID=UPI00262B8774|nr:protein ninH [uncultured Cedecea sp.]